MTKNKLILILIFSSIFVTTSLYLNAQGYIAPKGCLNCPPHPTKEKVEVSFYYKKGNPDCIRVQKLLELLSLFSGSMSLQTRDISLPENREMLDILFEIYYSGQENVEKFPAIFIGNKLFVGYRDIYENFYLPLMSELQKEPPKTIKDKLSRFLKEVKIFFIDNFGKFLGITVIIAGLIDGINPCAISLLIFFIFSLSRLKGDGKLMLSIGFNFILGIFISYFFIGIGLLKLIISPLFISMYNWIYIVIGVLAFIISGISIWDFYYAKNKETRNIKLQLPITLKRIGHSLVRDISLVKNPSLIFGLGVIMSFIEFPCSGQVYLPTVTLIGNPLSNIKPFLLLLLYNFMFILPLIIIVVVSILWSSSDRASQFVSKNLALTKLITAVLFFLLGAYMFVFV